MDVDVRYDIKEVNGKRSIVETRLEEATPDAIRRRIDYIESEQRHIVENMKTMKRSFNKNQELIDVLKGELETVEVDQEKKMQEVLGQVD